MVLTKEIKRKKRLLKASFSDPIGTPCLPVGREPKSSEPESEIPTCLPKVDRPWYFYNYLTKFLSFSFPIPLL